MHISCLDRPSFRRTESKSHRPASGRRIPMDTRSATTGRKELTLRDRLSRLAYTEVCRLLGSEGPQLIRLGGGFEIKIEEHVYLGEDLFRLSLPEAVVTITAMA